FWNAVRDVDPDAPGQAARTGAREGELVELSTAAGLQVEADARLTVTVPRAPVDQWWEPLTLGVGPAGAYVAGLDADVREAVRRRYVEMMPEAPTTAAAWAVRARVPG